MSLKLSFEAHAGPRLRLVSSKAPPPVTLDSLESTLLARLGELGAYHSVRRVGDHLLVSLHPAEESLSLWLSDGLFKGSARTSGAGPGYHVFVVDLLTFLAERLHLTWQVDDPSGYWESRDRRALEEEMGGFLKRVLDDLDADSLKRQGLWTVNFPARRTVVDAPYPILTPVGPWDERTVDSILSSRQSAHLAPYFPWWNELDGRYWHSVGQALRWMEVIWTPYEPPGQRAVREACLSAFSRSQALDPGLPVPKPEMKRLKELLSSRSGPVRSASARPKADRFQGGYRLFQHRWTIAGRWEIELPGDFTQPLPGESGTWAIVGPGTEIFLTPYGSLDPSIVRSRQAAKSMVRQLSSSAQVKGEVMQVLKHRGPGEGEAVVWKSPGGELLLQGAKPGPGTFALVTFMAKEEPAQPASWSPIWRSLAAIC